MLGHRLRRWPNIKATLVQRLVFAGKSRSTLVALYSPNEQYIQCMDMLRHELM